MLKLRAIFVSVLAITAVGAFASVSKAAEGTAVVSAGSTSWTVSQTEAHTFSVGVGGGNVMSCQTVTFSGTIADGSKQLEVFPAYEGCNFKVLGSTLPVTFEPTGCTYRFYERIWSARPARRCT